MDLANKLFRGDRVIWIIFMFLCLISVIEVFSATSTIAYKNANFWAPIVRHTTFLLGGFVLILLLHNIPCRFFPAFILLLPISILMLLITPFIGVSANDAHRWLEIFGIQFQPSEFAKLASIVFIAFMLSKRKQVYGNQIFKTILIGIGIPVCCILPENFSTAIMLFAVCFLMMFIVNYLCKSLMRIGGSVNYSGSCLLCIVIVYTRVFQNTFRIVLIPGKAYRTVCKSDENEETTDGVLKVTDDNYQVVHAKIAIARGGLIGQMPGHGQQRDFLPQAYSDFIYAIIIEELGFIGGMVVLLLYVILLVRVGMIARKCDKLFPKFLVLGCGLLLVIQALANMR